MILYLILYKEFKVPVKTSTDFRTPLNNTLTSKVSRKIYCIRTVGFILENVSFVPLSLHLLDTGQTFP